MVGVARSVSDRLACGIPVFWLPTPRGRGDGEAQWNAEVGSGWHVEPTASGTEVGVNVSLAQWYALA